MKRFEKVIKLTDNPFLNMYDMDAVKPNGDLFKYYFATRRGDGLLRIDTHSTDPDGISLFAVYGEKKDRVVLIREFRYPINDFIYDVPAGLIEDGEDAKKAAIREFREETGMVFEPVSRGNGAARKSTFPTVGLTDEMISTEYGYAYGTPDKSFMESSEDITTVIADRDELRRIIKEERVAMRALFLIMLFLNAPEEDPFSFLDC
ncbi:MAG: NUDIX hydrolase [Lachnospiraceae bacterium]|nr:NUDIX hydrolase [Lachnospiraceae bacterium]